MSFIEKALRDLVAEEVRRVIHEERAALYGPVDALEYLPVADAAARVAVAPATIRTWIAEGKLRRYHAGRVLRVRWSELEFLLRSGPEAADRRATPEEEAKLYLQRRKERRTRTLK
jgi:excisionase family DNA binding protein